MSSSYDFFDINGDFYKSFEEYQVNQAKVFCKVMGLPQIPMNGGSYNEKYYRMPGGSDSVILPIKKDKIHTTIHTSYKMLKQYAHWKMWGISKLNMITIIDLQGKFFIKYKHCYETEESFEEIKNDILELVDAYASASYYRYNF